MRFTVSSTQTVDQKLKRLRRNDIYLTFGVIAALLLGAGLAIGYGVWISKSQAAQNTQIRNALNSITQLNMEVMQIVVETSNLTSTTVLQSGTFEWVLTETGSGNNCFNSGLFFNVPQVTFNGTYELQSVRIGTLNFTLLVVSPPVEGPLVSELQHPALQVCLVRFAPFISTLDDYGIQGEANNIAFTHANLNRITISPDCIGDETCYISSDPIEGYPFRDSYEIRNEFPDDVPQNGGGYIRYIYLRVTPGFLPALSAVTLSEPLQLMLFQS